MFPIIVKTDLPCDQIVFSLEGYDWNVDDTEIKEFGRLNCTDKIHHLTAKTQRDVYMYLMKNLDYPLHNRMVQITQYYPFNTPKNIKFFAELAYWNRFPS